MALQLRLVDQERRSGALRRRSVGHGTWYSWTDNGQKDVCFDPLFCYGSVVGKKLFIYN